MAIYHFSGTVISRSQGRSAIAAAAYRSGEKMYDERQERAMNYSNKQDVIYKEIVLPEGAPVWMGDRGTLWNAVEKAETRKDSQVAREIQFTLPRELSNEQNIKLAREFVQDQFVARGMVADLCIHSGKTKEGEEQPHVHVMLTTREVTPDGFGLKDRSWNGRENMLLWRESWSEYANKYLALNGIDQRIDHRSFAEQGINLVPQNKIGATNLKDHERRVEEHRRIAHENGQRILRDPSIALNAITHHQSTFTMHDLARFINRHTVDAEQFQLVYEKVKGLDLIVSLGRDEKNSERFSTREMLEIEKQMLNDVVGLQNKGHAVAIEGVKSKDSIIEKTISSIESLKPIESTDKGNLSPAPSSYVSQSSLSSVGFLDSLSIQQKGALEHITGAGDIKCLIGYAGSGKSHLLNEARQIWENNGYKVHGTTLSGIAAENLEGSSGIESRTFHSRSYYWDTGRHLGKKDILVIDEAGMLGTRQLAKAIAEVKNYGAKLVLIGDPQQLQAIEAGAAFRAISDKASYIELTEVRRQQEAWQQQATKEFATRDVESAISRYDKHNHLHDFETQAEAKTSMVEMWNDVRITQPDKTQIMLSYTRKDSLELNEIAREMRKQNNELGKDQILKTSIGNKAFAEGDRIYFLRNNRDLGVMNGTLGTIERIADNKIKVLSDKDDFDGNKKAVSFDIRDYNHITHGYAATIHKAQGVTVDRSYLFASRHLDSHAAYVGMSRHRESVDLFWSKEAFANNQSLLHALGRDRSKEIALDYFQDKDGRYVPGEVILEADQEQIQELSETTEQAEKGIISAPKYSEPAESREQFEIKIDRVIKDCSKYTDIINSGNTLLQQFRKEHEDGDSPYVRERISEATTELEQYLKDNCNDKDVLTHLKQHEPKLFNDIDKLYKNIATSTLKGIESRELLADLTKNKPGLYEQILSMEKQYKELKQMYLEADKKADFIKEDISLSEYEKRMHKTKEIKGELKKHACEICKDADIAIPIKQYNPALFDDINKGFDNMFTKAIKDHELQARFTNSYPELFDRSLSIEERTNRISEQYKELKQAYIYADKQADFTKDDMSLSEFKNRVSAAGELNDDLKYYAHEAFKDDKLQNHIKKTNADLYNEIQEKFNEFEKENLERLQEMQKEIER